MIKVIVGKKDASDFLTLLLKYYDKIPLKSSHVDCSASFTKTSATPFTFWQKDVDKNIERTHTMLYAIDMIYNNRKALNIAIKYFNKTGWALVYKDVVEHFQPIIKDRY